MKINYSKLIPCLILPLIVGAISGFLTVESIPNWYAGLSKPFLNPPNWIFGPVWTTLYILMGLAFYLYNNSKNKAPKTAGNIFFYSQLTANFLWSVFFFNLNNLPLSVADIAILILLIIGNIYYFYQSNKTSAYLLIPYLLWVSFASYLNISIWLIN